MASSVILVFFEDELVQGGQSFQSGQSRVGDLAPGEVERLEFR